MRVCAWVICVGVCCSVVFSFVSSPRLVLEAKEEKHRSRRLVKTETVFPRRNTQPRCLPYTLLFFFCFSKVRGATFALIYANIYIYVVSFSFFSFTLARVCLFSRARFFSFVTLFSVHMTFFSSGSNEMRSSLNQTTKAHHQRIFSENQPTALFTLKSCHISTSFI